jgi:Protein of unknown function (DUF2442)
MHSITEADVLDGYRIRLRFEDGTVGIVDLEDRLWGPMFESLRDPAVFRRVRVEPQAGTITWPNGADLAPDMLYREASRPTAAT